MGNKSIVWWIVVIIESICIIGIGYVFYNRRIISRPKKISVLPIAKDTRYFPQDTALNYYSEPKANISKQEDLSYIGIPAIVTHTFNADGLNERFNYSFNKDKGVFRILSLGDSFTEGAWVDTKDNYSELLEDHQTTQVTCPLVSRFEVINLGVEGYDMQYTLERLKRKGLRYTPDLIILWTNENDYVENNERLVDLSMTFDPASQAPELVAAYREKGDYYPELSVLIDRFYMWYPHQALVDEEISYLQELLRISPSPVLLFTLSRVPDEIQQSIRSVLRPQDRFFPDIPDSYAAFADYHPSNEGHRQFADFLFQNMRNTYLAGCRAK